MRQAVLSDLRIPAVTSLTICLLFSLVACADSPTGKTLERSLAADPRLQDDPNLHAAGSRDVSSVQQASHETPKQASVTLPKDFPVEIPRYPDAVLQEVQVPEAGSTAEKETLTRWLSSKPIDALGSFYQRQFQSNSWQLIERSSDHRGSVFIVRYKDLQVRLSLRPVTETESSVKTVKNSESAAPSNAAGKEESVSAERKTAPTQTGDPVELKTMTELLIRYVRDPAGETDAVASDVDRLMPKPGDAEFVGPARPDNLATAPSLSTGGARDVDPDRSSSTHTSGEIPFSDLATIPPALQPWVTDVAKLGILRPGTPKAKANSTNKKSLFEPNKPISRREYARWLVAANNRLHDTQTANQIRLGVATAKPAFQDVARTDPDFPAIQGLAEAGILASPLSGDATTVLFRPDAPLTREQLILSKVPLDTRQGLPKATLEAVQQTWGFQDAARIDPKAMRAVLADFQIGDRANIRRVFGYTTLFQPQKPVTRAEAAAALWYFGTDGEGRSAREILQLENVSN